MGVTIYDIAERAGVSIATVSRVFNNSPRVSPRTRSKILDIAEQLGYTPHASAQSLARRSSQLISAVVPVMTNYFYMEILRGIQDALASTEFDLLIYTAPRPEEIDGQLERAAQRGRSEGILLLSTPLTEDRIQRLKVCRQPIVLVDTYHPDFDSITVDNERGGRLATEYLIRLGYERIGLITVSPEPPPAAERRMGYEAALREAGMSVDPDLVAASSRTPYGFVEEAGFEAMNALIGRGMLPEAVFVVSDIQALGVLHALREAGIGVPDEVAVIGFDGIEVTKYVGLTTMTQPMYEMGTLAVEKLVKAVETGKKSTSHTRFAPRLAVRATTRAPKPVAENTAG